MKTNPDSRHRRDRVPLLAVAAIIGCTGLAAASVWLDGTGNQLNRQGAVSGVAVMSAGTGNLASGVLGEFAGGISTNAAGDTLEAGHVPFLAGAPLSAGDWAAHDTPTLRPAR